MLEQHGELVAAEPRHGVAARMQVASRPDADEQRSPAAWPSPSFTVLKPSRSTKSTARRAAAARLARERVRDAIAEQRAIREPGERIVERLPRELRLERFALGHVLQLPRNRGYRWPRSMRETVRLPQIDPRPYG